MSAWISRVMRQISVGIPAACHDANKSYEEAVRALNTLQSNAAVIEKLREDRHKRRHLQLPQTIEFASRAGITLSDIDKLSVIHVSGTKGKGSTCAFCESILRHHGYKTGFYSSPHLVEVRERIRINGNPLPKDAFSTYFWDVFKSLENAKTAEHDMPSYFRFLTIMAYHVFLQEKVDVAIIEVGIGGRYDCTNIVRSPVVCGVSSLGMDHIAILGDTLEKIAWNKAGIFKPSIPAVTVQQPGNSMQTLVECAKEIKCPLYVTQDAGSYNSGPHHQVELGIAGDIQKRNASLALQLCNIWLKDHNKSLEERKAQYSDLVNPEDTAIPATDFPITEQMLNGLRNCQWAGRNQTLKQEGLTYYLDGAHTPRSIQQCVDWFVCEADKEKSTIKGKVVRILMFNTTGDRRPDTLLRLLKGGQFDCAVFCPNIATMASSSADQTNYTVTLKSQFDRCVSHKNLWLRLANETSQDSTIDQGQATTSNVLDSGEVQPKRSRLTSCTSIEYVDETTPVLSDLALSNEGQSKGLAYTFDSIQDALMWVSQGRDSNLPPGGQDSNLPPGGQDSNLPPGGTDSIPEALQGADHIQVLCTGSLHLIGGVVKLTESRLLKDQ